MTKEMLHFETAGAEQKAPWTTAILIIWNTNMRSDLKQN